MLKVFQKIQSNKCQVEVDYRQVVYEESCRFFKNKRQQHMQQMKGVIEELQSDKRNEPLIQFIRSIIDGCKFTRCQQMFKKVTGRIVQIIKQTLSSIQQQMMTQEGQFYKATAQFNSTLVKYSRHKDKKWLNMFKQPQELVKINILPYFFYHNREYKNKSFFEIFIWTAEELSSYLGIPSNYILKLYRYYKDCPNLSTLNYNIKLDNLIAVLSLARFKTRVSNIKRKKAEQYIDPYKNRAWKFNKSEESTQNPVQCQSETYLFSFCQIAMFARQKQTKLIPIVRKQFVEKQISKILSSSSEFDKKQQILILKMQFHLPFHVIEKVLSNTMKNNIKSNNIYFEQELQKDLSIFEQKIQGAFSFELYPMKAIKILNLEKEYKTKITSTFNITQWRSDVTACFVKVSLRMFRKYYELTDIQLKLEEFIAPIMHVNKFYFSYHDLVGANDKLQQNDLVLTLIMGMQDKKVIFFETKRQKEENDTYLDFLSKILKQSVEKLPSAIVLFDDQRVKPVKWNRFCSFANFIHTKYRSRTYTCYQSSRNKRSVKLFLYIKTFLKLILPMLKRDYFFICAEQYIKKIVKLHNYMVK